MHNPPHPGILLKELLFEPLKITVEEAADAVGITPEALSLLIDGKISISNDMATRLSVIRGTTPKYWLNLQAQYDRYAQEQYDSYKARHNL